MLTQKIPFFVLILILVLPGSLFSQYTHPTSDDEFVGPFPSWINVKTQHGAIGNGITDDTRSIQAALDAIGLSPNSAAVVYLPAGTYRITGTLKLQNKIKIGMIGEDPSSTILKWDGPANGTMFLINGIAYSRFNRMTFDGAGIAKIAVDQSWDGVREYFDTGNEFADNVFTDVGYGIHGGFGFERSFAEVAVMRCKFIRNSMAGVSLGNFNALDIWIWNSIFEDCAVGLTNTLENGAGGFKVYNSIFRRSTIADIKIGNTIEFSFRDNTSINSKAFILAGFTANACQITVQGNKIIDPIDNTPINIQNQGQLMLVDNTIRSRAGAIGPVVSVSGPPTSDCFAIGNVFTVANPIQAGKNIVYQSSIVQRSSLANLAEQTLPGTQPNLNRPIFEVPRGANAALIQTIINQAHGLSGQRPIVHLPNGQFNIDTTLVIPIGSDIQLVGDSYNTILRWLGNKEGYVLKVEGPSKATVRDLLVHGNSAASGILVTKADQIGSRIFTHQSESHTNKINYSIHDLDKTLILLTNSGSANARQHGIKLTGGKLAASGISQPGRTVVYAGATSDNAICYEVANAGNLLIRDVWYESRYVNQYLRLPNSGTFTVEGSHIANTNADQTSIPQFEISNFTGKASFLNSSITGLINLTGDNSRSRLMALCVCSDHENYIKSTGIPAQFKSFNCRAKDHNSHITTSGSYAIDNIGTADESFITDMLQPMRSVHSQILSPLANDVTDFRIYRVFVEYANAGFEFEGFGADYTLLDRGVQSIKAFANATGNEIEWTAREDVDIKRFDVERSLNGRSFEKIGSVNKDQRSNASNKFSWCDTKPATGKNYYRVKSISSSNGDKYSLIVHVAVDLNRGITFYPNPIQGKSFNLSFNDMPVGSYAVHIVNNQGQPILAKKIMHPGGDGVVNLSLDIVLPNGTYTLQVKSESDIFTRQIVK